MSCMYALIGQDAVAVLGVQIPLVPKTEDGRQKAAYNPPCLQRQSVMGSGSLNNCKHVTRSFADG